MPVLLLVDDDEPTARAMTRLLERVGYTAVWLSSGDDALHVMKDLRFDLVILDWMMPGMDGIQVLRSLRADAVTRDIPVIMYSASDDRTMEQEAVRLGAVDCVLKAGGFPALFDRVEAYLDAAAGRGRRGTLFTPRANTTFCDETRRGCHICTRGCHVGSRPVGGQPSAGTTDG